MKILIVYDSVYGNTEQIAGAVARGLATGDVQVQRIDADTITAIGEQDLLIIGSPTQRGKPTSAIQELLENIPRGALERIKVAAFDTRISLMDRNWLVRTVVDILGYAAGCISKGLKKKGGSLLAKPQGFLVAGTDGPIVRGELERAEKWGGTLMNKYKL